MDRKIKALEIQIEKLRALEKPTPPVGPVLRRSARRQSIAMLPSVDENTQPDPVVAARKPATRESSRRKSLIPLPPKRVVKRKDREEDSTGMKPSPAKTPKRSATSTPKSDRKLRSTKKRMSLNVITNVN